MAVNLVRRGRLSNAEASDPLERLTSDSLQRKAERRHQSLQQYLAVELRHLAEQRSISEILDEVEARHGGRVGLQAAVADLEEERSQR